MADELTTLRARYELAWMILEWPDASEDDLERANEVLDEVTPRMLELMV